MDVQYIRYSDHKTQGNNSDHQPPRDCKAPGEIQAPGSFKGHNKIKDQETFQSTVCYNFGMSQTHVKGHEIHISAKYNHQHNVGLRRQSWKDGQGSILPATVATTANASLIFLGSRNYLGKRKKEHSPS
jgi:hypothetical protein